MSGGPCITPPAKESLQIETARAELFKEIEELRVMADKLAERLSPIRDLNEEAGKPTSDKENFPPACSHALELLDAAHRVYLIREVVLAVFRDLQI